MKLLGAGRLEKRWALLVHVIHVLRPIHAWVWDRLVFPPCLWPLSGPSPVKWARDVVERSCCWL